MYSLSIFLALYIASPESLTIRHPHTALLLISPTLSILCPPDSREWHDDMDVDAGSRVLDWAQSSPSTDAEARF